LKAVAIAVGVEANPLTCDALGALWACRSSHALRARGTHVTLGSTEGVAMSLYQLTYELSAEDLVR